MNRGVQIAVIVLLLVLVVAGAVALALPLLREGTRYGVLPGPEWTPVGGVATIAPVNTLQSTTPEPSPQVTPLLTADVAAGPLNLRSGPGTSNQVVGSAQAGQRFEVVGRNADNSWIKLCCVNTQRVWAAAQFLKLDGPVDRAPITDQ